MDYFIPMTASSYPRLIRVSIRNQRLSLLHYGKPVKIYSVSTAKRGAGNRKDSLQTPLGRHRIYAKIGGRAVRGAIFKDRKNTGRVWDGKDRSGDLILSRILRLEGMEKGVNKGGVVDTRSRYIYIHGTSHRKTIGRPASHGCVTMKCEDIIDLYKRVKKGDPVVIA